MNRSKEDPVLSVIMKTIAKNPGASLYKIAKEAKLDHVKVMRKISQYCLVSKEILRMEQGKRGAQNYWLTFRGLDYAVQHNYDYEKTNSLIKEHRIEMPLVGDKDLNYLLKCVSHGSPFCPMYGSFMSLFMRVMGKDRISRLIEFAVTNFPHTFFNNSKTEIPFLRAMYPWPFDSRNEYIMKLVLRAVYTLFYVHSKTPKLPDSKMFDLIGEDAYAMVGVLDKGQKRLPSIEDYLNVLSPNMRRLVET